MPSCRLPTSALLLSVGVVHAAAAVSQIQSNTLIKDENIAIV
jgi:hypothetical protein